MVFGESLQFFSLLYSVPQFIENLQLYALILGLVLGRKLGNYMIFNGIHLFSRNEDFGETHQKSHFLLILAI